MKFYSPLRYPGGKAFLAPLFEDVIERSGLKKPIYVEPYAGGAGAALSLLFAEKVKQIVINDLDHAIFLLWKAVVYESERFARKLLLIPVTIEEWKKQRATYQNPNADIFERGFAAFFLNRTNISGVMNAGPIGGKNQDGSYKIDVRFNKKNLAVRVRRIGKYRNRIIVTKKDGIGVAKKYLAQKDTFVYLDPPYYKKGTSLYMNHYRVDDHSNLAKLLNSKRNSRWVLTYDDVKPIRKLYPQREKRQLTLSYRVNTVRRARELMIFSDALTV